MKRFFSLAVLLAVLSVVFFWGQTTTTEAQASRSAWQAEFFDNRYFIGDPVFTETRNAVNFNFGTQSPRDGFPSENYTIRISTDVHFDVGNYRFYMFSSDGATVTFDFNRRVIDTFSEPRPDELITGELQVTIPGVYHIQIDYRQNTGPSYIYFDYESTADGISGPSFPTFSDQVPVDDRLEAVGNLFWTGQYYSNRDLAGAPTVIDSHIGLSFDWGFGSPYPSIPVDNFSARWNAAYAFGDGEYVVRVRVDDGVRVYLDGDLIINEWRETSAQTYNALIRPGEGIRTFTVEYFEATAVALIDFQLFRVTEAPPVAVGSPYNAFATVIASRLNVRNAPDAVSGAVIQRVNGGETYAVVGKRADERWVQINTGTIIGWVSAGWVDVTNLDNVPVTSGEGAVEAPQDTGFTVFTRTEVNLRTGPSTSFERIVIIPQNVTANIIGRNERATWWQVNYNGTVGWVSATFAVIEQDAPDLNRIPITN